MNAIRRAVRAALLVGAVVGAVVLGLVAQAGAYFVGFTSSSGVATTGGADHGLSHAAPGPHRVGVRRIGSDVAPVALTAWYPAADTVAAADEPPMRYSYSLTVLGPNATTALATYQGEAQLGAEGDLTRGPYPLVVLSSGFAITPGSYAWLAEHLASHGMVVVAPRHEETLDPSTLWRSAVARPEAVAATRRYVEEAAAPGRPLAGLVDPATVAVLGHSYGGYTALAAGGARLDAEAFRTGCSSAREDDDPIVFLCDALEPRFDDVVAGSTTRPRPVDAVVSLAGHAAMFGEAGLDSLTAPLLVVGGTADRDSPFDWSTRLAYDGASSERKVEVSLDGAAHFVFSGECDKVRRIVRLVALGFCDDPAWDRERARTVVRHYVTAFLLAQLTGARAAQSAVADREAPPGVGLRSTGKG